MINLEHVNKQYLPTEPFSLKDVSLSVADGECISIVGPSGCGKTTLIKIIAGLEKESSGTVVKPDSISMVFQNGALFPWLNVYNNIAFGLRAKSVSETSINKEVLKYAEMLGLGNFLDKFPRELSGGQRQRVGIARALAVDPQVLLLDEPFSALDAKTTHDLHVDLVKIWQETKKTMILISHSIEEAVSIGNKVILMKDGGIMHTYEINLSRPRREQGEAFMKEVMTIRRAFFES